MSQTKRTKKNWATLPLTRVSAIMKNAPKVYDVTEDAVVITAKAAELFLVHLAMSALKVQKNDSNVEYEDVANAVLRNEQLAFLKDYVPNKITVEEYRRIVSEGQKKLADEEDAS